MSATKSALRCARRVFRSRSPIDTSSTAFVVYSGVLIVLIALAPTARATILALTSPSAMAILSSPGAASAAGLILGVCVALLPALGGVFGPAFIGHPFFAHVLMKTDLSRSTVLARPLLVSLAVFSTFAATASALLSGALVVAGRATIEQSAAFVAGAVCLSIVAGIAWLAGQRLGRRVAWAASAVLIGAVLLTSVIPEMSAFTPWGWAASMYPESVVGLRWQLPTLAMFAALSVTFVPLLLRSMPGQEVVDQAIRWNTAAITAGGGDPAAALARFRALPSWGRSRAAVPHAPHPTLLFLWRDLAGAARTPVRFGAAVLGLLGAGVLGSSMGHASPVRVAIGGVALLVAFVALGPLTDGLRHAAEAFAAPSLYGYAPSRLVGLHTLQPLTTSVLAMVAGFAVAHPDDPTALAFTIWSAGHATLLRAFDSAKGALSPALLNPIPTPFGDLSALVIVGWHLDAVLLAGLGGIAIALCGAVYPFAVTVVAASCGSAVIAGMTIWRFRRM